jgi:hypothetical protein
LPPSTSDRFGFEFCIVGLAERIPNGEFSLAMFSLAMFSLTMAMQ